MSTGDETTVELREQLALCRQRFEANSLDLHEKNQELLQVNSLLEQRVRERTAELAEAVARAQRANAAKGEFLARMSHEIRTPMNGILGMLEALQSTPLNDVQLDYLRTAYGSAEMLLTLINDILDYSKIEAGRLSVEKIDFDLPAMLQSIVRLWRKRAGDKGVNLNLTIDPACPGWVIGDPTRIGQILTNLVSNALKFTERGDVAVLVDVLSSEAQRGRLRFTVRDTGVGMNPSVIDRLFTAFAQADGTTSRRYGGTGLGLAISQQLAHLMGSQITVASALGEGSEFAFVLDLPRGEPPYSRTMAQRALRAAESPLIARRVLVVDDNETNRKVAGVILASLGIDVGFACDGAEAVQAVCEHAYEVVFMDCHMPGLDGFEATLAIRRWEQEQQRPRMTIIAVSASAFQEDRDRCSAAGMDAFLAKPLNTAAVRAALQQISRPDSGGAGTPGGTIRSVSTAAGSAMFDLDHLAEMRAISGPDFPELVSRFVSGAREQLSALREAVLAGDSASVRRVAHRLKGSSAAMGARLMSAQCHAIEVLGAAGDIGEIGARIDRLAETTSAVCSVLETMVPTA